ncbi:MAG: MFS transporter [Bacteroidales bacterium]|nr:MFS transporter [Candidatus Colimorpha merdihippi]MCQ2281263.1 MFS transporter [Bacteroidales bacterium]
MEKKKTNVVAIVTMFFMFAMISFVTNMAAPFGNIWKIKDGMEWSGMLGNLMNFTAYLIMGIPAGKMLSRIGYKKTALTALAVGFFGMLIQMASSFMDVSYSALVVYLLGAFVCGFCVCMLNTVVNPMLNLLGGGGNRGNQLIQAGGTLNSLTGTATPLLAGAMIGTLTKDTALANVRPLLLIALGVFLLSFIIIYFVAIPEPNQNKSKSEGKDKYSAWSFRHLVLGVTAIFFYVGVEVGIPGELNFYLSDPTAKGAGLGEGAAVIGGAIAAVYWLLMFVGRLASTAISGKVSSKTQITVVSAVAIIFLLIAIFLPKSMTMSMPGYQGGSFTMVVVPVSALFIVLCGLCTSLMWGGIFNLAVEGLGKYTEQASGIFMMMVVGGGVMPFIQDWIARATGYMTSYWLVIAMLAFILYYAIAGCKNVNKDIPVE